MVNLRLGILLIVAFVACFMAVLGEALYSLSRINGRSAFYDWALFSFAGARLILLAFLFFVSFMVRRRHTTPI